MIYFRKFLTWAILISQVFSLGLAASAFDNSVESEFAQLGSDPESGSPDTANISYEKFSDLSEGEWYQECITYTLENGYFTGLNDTVFLPESKVTRIQFMTIMYRVGVNLGFYSSAVTTGTSWKLAGAELSSDLGFMWTSEDMECVISREEVCAIGYIVLYNRISSEYDLVAARAYTAFTDESNIEPDYLSAIKSMYIAGGIDGYSDGSFRPDNSAKRCEIAKFIYNLLEVMRIAAKNETL